MVWKKWIAGLALIVCRTVLADGWTCDITPAQKISPRVANNIEVAYQETDYARMVKKLEESLSLFKGDSKAAVYEAIAIAQMTSRKFEAAAASYRAVFDLESASVPVRERARGALAIFLVDQGRVRELVALYERNDRPICGTPSPEATYALALAYNALGDDAKARRVFDAGQVTATEQFKQNVTSWNRWRLLRLRLDCVQKRWPECNQDLQDFADPWVAYLLPKELDAMLGRLRSIPELRETIERLEKDGLIDDKGFVRRVVIDSEVTPISCPPIHRPLETQGINGRVYLQMLIDETGKPVQMMVIESTPAGVFDRVLLQSAAGCRFKPHVVNGKATQIVVRRVWNFLGPK